MNYQPVRSENQANKHAGPQEANHNAGAKDNIDSGDSEKEDESSQDIFVLPIWSSYSSTVKRSTTKDAGESPNKHPDLKTDEKPVDKEDSGRVCPRTEDLLLQEGAAKTSSTNIVNTASTPVSIVLKIHTDDNVVDLLTKAFDVSRQRLAGKNILESNLDAKGVSIQTGDKGKKKIEEEDESETESEDIPEAEKKFKQLARDEEMARKLQEDWETEEERKRLAEEESYKDLPF
ncbi:hypothetical protein Tco_0472429 [Tanacetum coccineum]